MNIKGIHHVAVATRSSADLEKLFSEKLGLTVSRRYDRNQKNILKSTFDFPNGSHIEFIQPVSGEKNACDSWIKNHGEAIYHFAIEVEDIDAALAELKQRGVALIDQEARVAAGGNRVAFIDPRDTADIMIELVERPAT